MSGRDAPRVVRRPGSAGGRLRCVVVLEDVHDGGPFRGFRVTDRLDCRPPQCSRPRPGGHISLRATPVAPKCDRLTGPGTDFRRRQPRLSSCRAAASPVYGQGVSWAQRRGPRWWSRWASDDLPRPEPARLHAGRDRAADASRSCSPWPWCAVHQSRAARQPRTRSSAVQIAVDLSARRARLLSLWWRRRWPVGVALICLLLGTVSISATPAGLLALSSLAVHRPARPTLLVTAAVAPVGADLRRLQPDHRPVSVVLFVMPLALAATGGACSSGPAGSCCCRCASAPAS